MSLTSQWRERRVTAGSCVGALSNTTPHFYEDERTAGGQKYSCAGSRGSGPVCDTEGTMCRHRGLHGYSADPGGRGNSSYKEKSTRSGKSTTIAIGNRHLFSIIVVALGVRD